MRTLLLIRTEGALVQVVGESKIHNSNLTKIKTVDTYSVFMFLIARRDMMTSLIHFLNPLKYNKQILLNISKTLITKSRSLIPPDLP